MPGAFAHITAANRLFSTNSLQTLDMPNEAKFILSTNVKFIELGCVSPDYPYLAIMNKAQNKWADLMHYEKTGELIKKLIGNCKQLEGETQKKAFAWLCGYVAHVIADITIHPVVESKVGVYEENQTDHRVCEMNQDAHIWTTLNLGEIGLADRVKLNIGSCTDEDGNLDSAITELWGSALKEIHQDYASSNAPDFQKWHSGFQTVVDNAEEGYRFFKWARHVAANVGGLYPRPDEIDLQYIEALDTPKGHMHYDDIFAKAVENIQTYVAIVGNAVFSDGSVEAFKNWNLDNGKDENGELTAWN